MEITKKEVEQLLGQKVLSFKITKVYRGYRVVKIKIVAIKESDSKETIITLNPERSK